jgi:hypothetical protein
MTTLVVYRALKNGSAYVYEGLQNGGGTQYTKTLSTTETSTVTLTKGSPTISRTLSAMQQSTVLLNKKIITSKSVTQTSTNVETLDENLAAALGIVSQNSVASIAKRNGLVKTVSKAGVVSLATVFHSGSSNTTYSITLNATQNSVATRFSGIQTVKSALQDSTISMVTAASGAGGVSHMTLQTTQNSTVSLLVRNSRQGSGVFGGPAGTAGQRRQRRKIYENDEPIPTPPPLPRPPPLPDVRVPALQMKLDPVEQKRRQEEDEIAMLLGS